MEKYILYLTLQA